MYLILVLSILLSTNNAYDLCSKKRENLCVNTIKSHDCMIESAVFDKRECSAITFNTNDNKIQNDLSKIKLNLYHRNGELSLNVSFTDVHFMKSYLKLSYYDRPNSDYFCKMYTVGKDVKLPIKSLLDTCFLNFPANETVNYVLEFKAEKKTDIFYKNILFNVPNLRSYSIYNAYQFYYIDYTDNYSLLLKLQTSQHHNLTNYKIEVFREKDNNSQLLDVRFLPPSNVIDNEITFEYITFNEEGLYYFQISLISAYCPEDHCFKTITPKIYVSRKGTPLVIGIVGASFIIPFILFIFYMWNRQFKSTNDTINQTVKNEITIIYSPSTQHHNNVVISLCKLLKDITNYDIILHAMDMTTPKKNLEEWCTDDLFLATYIIYIPPPQFDSHTDLDNITHNFLAEKQSDNIIVLYFPYSNENIPQILKNNTAKYHLMDEFEQFIKLLKNTKTMTNILNNLYYGDLMKKIKAAKYETDMKINSMPKIIITEDLNENEEESTEKDGLL